MAKSKPKKTPVLSSSQKMELKKGYEFLIKLSTTPKDYAESSVVEEFIESGFFYLKPSNSHHFLWEGSGIIHELLGYLSKQYGEAFTQKLVTYAPPTQKDRPQAAWKLQSGNPNLPIFMCCPFTLGSTAVQATAKGLRRLECTYMELSHTEYAICLVLPNGENAMVTARTNIMV